MRRRSLLVVAAIALSVGGQAYAAHPDVSTEAMPGVNFAGFKTFNWVKAPIPQGMDPVAYERMQNDVADALINKGYQQANPADISLVLTVGARQKTDFNSWGFFGNQLDVYQYTQGKLSVDAFDNKTRQAVWHGQASETINPNKPDPAKVDSAINKMMVKFPAGGGGGAAPPAAGAPASPP
jgi:hypothetical protein